MMKRLLYVLLPLMFACSFLTPSQPTAPAAPTETRIVLPTLAPPTATLQPTLESTPTSTPLPTQAPLPMATTKCGDAATVEVKLKEAIMGLIASRSIGRDWPAETQIKVVQLDPPQVQFTCLYEVKLWGSLYDQFSGYSNVEYQTVSDALAFEKTAEVVFGEDNSYVVQFSYDGSEGFRTRVQLPSLVEGYVGGILLFTNYLP